jgi:hypothetical protein
MASRPHANAVKIAKRAAWLYMQCQIKALVSDWRPAFLSEIEDTVEEELASVLLDGESVEADMRHIKEAIYQQQDEGRWRHFLEAVREGAFGMTDGIPHLNGDIDPWRHITWLSGEQGVRAAMPPPPPRPTPPPHREPVKLIPYKADDGMGDLHDDDSDGEDGYGCEDDF